MVYPGQHIPGMEREWISIMDSWQSYVAPALIPTTTINLDLKFSAGAGKSILWYVVLVGFRDGVVIRFNKLHYY
jgi:hypothetical protein